MKTNWKTWAVAVVIAVGSLARTSPAKAQGFSFGFSTGPSYYGGYPLLCRLCPST